MTNQGTCINVAVATCLVGLLSIAGGASANPDGIVRTQTIARSGEAAPGLDPEADFVLLCRPVINNSGAVVFEALLDRAMTGPEADNGIWVWDGSTVRLVAWEGDLSGNFAQLQPPQLLSSDEVVFMATDASGVAAIWREQVGVAERIVGLGDPVLPDDELLAGFLTQPIPGPGFVSFAATHDASPDSDYFWMWTTRFGSLDLVLPVDTTLPDSEFDAGEIVDLTLSTTGDHVFTFTSDVDPLAGVWRERDGGLVQVVDAQDYDPSDPDTYYRHFKWLACGDRRTGFYAEIRTGDVDPRAIYLANDSGVQQFVTHYDEAPNLPGVQVRFFSHPQVLDNDEVVLTAALTGDGIDESNNVAIWRGEPDDLQLIAREGEHIPGLASDVVIRDFQAIAVNEDYAALYVSLFGYTVGDNDRALILIDADGDKHLVTRVGDKFDVAGDGSDLRSVKHIGMLPADPERGRSPLNAGGTVAFMLEFYDGSNGVFTAHLASPCVGDIDGDDDTDQSDLGLLLASYELDPSDPDFNIDADLNGDGAVGQPDLGILLADYECDPHNPHNI